LNCSDFDLTVVLLENFMTFNLLALDGGGIRGYMTAKIMRQLEIDSGVDFTAKSAVNGYSGTSTGGLLAIGLANGHSPEDLKNLYRDKAGEIFERNTKRKIAGFVRAAASNIPKMSKLMRGMGVFKSEYVADGLKRIAEGLVGNATFGNFDPDRVLAVNTAAMKIPNAEYDEGWTSTTMCNHALERSRLGDSRKIRQLDGALSTAAAPSYFPPHHVVVEGESKGFFADGGLFANNPVMNGMTVAMAANLAQMSDFRVISIGTGIDTRGIPETVFDKPLGFGILEWLGAKKGVPVGALLNITMTTSADNMTWISGNLLGDNIVRLNPVLSKRVALDGISDADFAVMDEAVADLIASPAWAPAVRMAKTWAGAGGS